MPLPLLPPPHPRPARRGPGSNRAGYTLMELLVVIGILVLIILMAIPAFSVISGNRSIEAAQNQLQAIIGRARQEAMGLQDYRGVILFTDPNTGRMAAAEVYYPSPGNSTLGIAPSKDEILMPKGVSFRTIENGGGYLPINVLMFDGQGQFTSRPWTFFIGTATQFTTQTPPADPTQRLSWRIQPALSAAPDWPAGMPGGTTSGTSAFGFILFTDEATYQASFRNNPNTTYLYDNGIGFLINRYNGTLLRTE